MEILNILNKYAKCYENKRIEEDHEPSLRLFRSNPTHVTLQIRAHCGIGELCSGKKRNMLAHLELNKDDLIALRNAINNEIERLSK